MNRKRNHYDSACYYEGKLVGRCTVADADTYSILMEECGNSAARVLREYAYFSPELKGILEKVAAKQQKTVQAASIFSEPRHSPWGAVQDCEILYPGIFLLTTEEHGGVMVAEKVASILPPEAQKCGFRKDGYLAFEEDTQENVVFRELLDRKLWKIPGRIRDKVSFEAAIDKSLKAYHPDYWKARQERLDKSAARTDKPRNGTDR